MNRSFQHDGVNAHLAKNSGVVFHISKADIYDQKNHIVVCRTIAPMFEAV